MTQSYRLRALVISVVCGVFLLSVMPVHADHSEESESASPCHAESVAHDHDEDTEDHQTAVVPTAVTISAPVAHTAQLQQLLNAMLQLVTLLQKQQEMIEHDATPHTHDEDEDHDEHTNDEDHA